MTISLRERYAEPHRFYHTWEHIYDMLIHAYTYSQPSADLLLAIMYHDAVYDPKLSTNEEDSAALLPESETVARKLILGTKDHIFDTAEGWLLGDLDFMILGSRAVRYDMYAENIRKEYSFLPPDTFYRGRRKVLQSILSRGAIFVTEAIRVVYEDRARVNIKRELEKSYA